MLKNSGLKKPLESMNRIIESLEPHATVYTKWKQTRYVPDLEGMVLILIEGKMDVYRDGDFIHMLTVDAPSIFGLARSDFTRESFHSRPSRDAIFITVPYDIASEIFYQSKIWHCVNEVMAFRSEFLIKYQQIFIKKTAREIITLLILNTEPEFVSGSLYAYILEKTVLSKSMVMSELSTMRSKGILEMDSGKLVKVNRELLQKHGSHVK